MRLLEASYVFLCDIIINMTKKLCNSLQKSNTLTESHCAADYVLEVVLERNQRTLTPNDSTSSCSIATISSAEYSSSGKSVHFNFAFNLTRMFRKKDTPVSIHRDYHGIKERSNTNLKPILRPGGLCRGPKCP
jgi:hypothetical protein